MSDVILEIKFQDAYPLWLAEILSHLRLQKTSFSKYGRAYEMKLSDEQTRKERRA